MKKKKHTTNCNPFKLSCVIDIKGNMFRWTFFVIMLSSHYALAQKALPQSQPVQNEDLIEIIKSDELEILNENGVESRRVTNGVFKHKGALLYSNLAIQNINTNIIKRSKETINQIVPRR